MRPKRPMPYAIHEPTRLPSTPAATIPTSVRWWWAPAPEGFATANPANSIVASEGIGMQALSATISRKTATRPVSPTNSEARLKSDSEIDARTSIAAQRYLGAERTAPGRSRPAGARLDRPDQQPSCAGHASGVRAATRGRSRGARHRPRLRADARALRPPGHPAHGDRTPPGRTPRRQGARPRLALGRARALGPCGGAGRRRAR